MKLSKNNKQVTFETYTKLYSTLEVKIVAIMAKNRKKFNTFVLNRDKKDGIKQEC